MNISNDSYAILLLCSNLGLNIKESDVRPYTTVQWSALAEKLFQNNMTPGALFDISTEDLKETLFLAESEIERIEKLLSRAGQLAVELSELNGKGIFIMTRCDEEYPDRLKKRLNRLAPPVLYYAGNLALLSNPGVAIVGSRNIDEAGLSFTEKLSERCTNNGLNIVSGGARGVDTVAEKTANKSDGTTVIFVADSLEKKIRKKETREAIMKKQSIVLSSTRPDIPFRVDTAMERNKYIYALSDFVVIISSDYEKGGTWAGAKENLKHGWVPMFIRQEEEIPEGNVQLLKEKNVYPISREVLDDEKIDILKWAMSHERQEKMKENIQAEQLSLF